MHFTKLLHSRASPSRSNTTTFKHELVGLLRSTLVLDDKFQFRDRFAMPSAADRDFRDFNEAGIHYRDCRSIKAKARLTEYRRLPLGRWRTWWADGKIPRSEALGLTAGT